jgi:hypothetical protein
MKLLYKVRSTSSCFNKTASDSLLLFCSIAKFYQSKELKKNKQDQNLVTKISSYIRLVMNPAEFRHKRVEWLENRERRRERQESEEVVE